MTEEERDEMMKSNWKAQMAAFNYGPDGLTLPQKETSGWISVKDRLPEKYGHYLVIRDNGFMSVDTWTRHSHWGKAVCKITHWMSLPEPPKE